MAETQSSVGPWLVAAWPGMGNVAVGAAAYLIDQLGATLVHELPAAEFFDLRHVDVVKGIARPAALPRSMFFEWSGRAGPGGDHRDLLVFLGEAQPQVGGSALCRRLMDYAHQRGVSRVFTFAAMATQLHPSQRPRTFGAATQEWMLPQLREYEVEVLGQGQIAGLNGLLLAAAAERNLPAACLLGELPFFAAGVQNPRASQAVLEVFGRLAGVELDFTRIAEAGREVEGALLQLLEQLRQAARQARALGGDDDDEPAAEEADDADERLASPEDRLTDADRARIEALFEAAHRDRAEAFHLKEELDRLDVFDAFEDRFLDLFKRAE